MNEFAPNEPVTEITIIARWKNGAFVPEQPLNLPENSKWRLTIVRVFPAEVDVVREMAE
jgi:hypothetical protein